MRRLRAFVVLTLLAGASFASSSVLLGSSACTTRLDYAFDSGAEGGSAAEAGLDGGPSGTVEALPLAFTDLRAMLSFGGRVFFAHAGGVSSCAKPACSTADLIPGVGAGTALAADGSVFAVRGDALVKCDLQNGLPACTPLAQGSQYAGGTSLQGDEQSFVWRRNGGDLVRSARTPSDFQRVLVAPTGGLELALARNSLYVTTEDDNAFFVFDQLAEQAADAGADMFARRVMFDGPLPGSNAKFERPRGIAITSAKAYVAVAGTPGQKNGYFLACSLTNCKGSHTRLLASLDDPTAMFLDGDFLYWAERAGTVSRISIDDPAVRPPLAAGLAQPRLLTFDETHVYVAVDGDTAGVSKVVRIAK